MSRTAAVRRLSVAAPPHIASGDTVRGSMLDVLIALVPALAVSLYFFGLRVLLLLAVTELTCIGCEFFWRFFRKEPATIGDLSAAVTGLILTLCLPVSMPLWAGALGGAFAIVVVKLLYGGLGKNFLNPAIGARMFLLAFPAAMNTFQIPGVGHWLGLGVTADAITSATPLNALRQGIIPQQFSLRQLFLGQRGGALGEVAVFALILGGLYLVLRGTIRLRIPLCYLGTVAILTFLFPQGGNEGLTWMLYELCSGGLMLAAFFVVTDPVTSPITRRGQMLYAICCGGLTVVLRYFGPYPEGVGSAILIMNLCVWFFDRLGMPRRFAAPGWKRRREGKGSDAAGT